MRLKFIISILFITVLLPRKSPSEIQQQDNFYPSSILGKIGDNPPPGNPMNDRAKLKLTQNDAKKSLTFKINRSKAFKRSTISDWLKKLLFYAPNVLKRSYHKRKKKL